MTTRRDFLKAGVMLLGASALFPHTLLGTPGHKAMSMKGIRLAEGKNTQRIFIHLFLRGAMDGLMAVCPYTDTYLLKARPRLFMTPSVKEGLIELDGRFGLHPSLAPLHPFFVSRQLSIIHGIGSTEYTRSHFDAQDFMETASPGDKRIRDGWLNRVLAASADKSLSHFRAVALTKTRPRSFYGTMPTLSISDLSHFGMSKGAERLYGKEGQKGFESLYEATATTLLRKTAGESFDASRTLQTLQPSSYTPLPGITYPESQFGRSLKQLAFLIKSNIGLELGFAELDGWDTHAQQGKTQGNFSRVAADFSRSLAAFWQDIEAYQDRTVVLTSTEFGRTIRENGAGGTDHGRASVFFLLSSATNGGKVYGSVPTLAPDNLVEGRDLPVTTDYRAVYADIALSHLGLDERVLRERVFPQFTGKPLGLLH